jgi:mono/diheme cytochrome c family protein
VRAIRHGINPSGRALMIMHSDAYNRLGASDLAAIIAYVRSVPPVNKEVPATRAGALGRILLALGMLDGGAAPMFPAEVIDHGARIMDAPPADTTPEYGQYVVAIALCGICHGGDLRGGPPIEADAPPGPDIVSTTAPGGWSEAQFVNTIRTGVTPFGHGLNVDVMPWKAYANMDDVELGAVWRYLNRLRERGG